MTYLEYHQLLKQDQFIYSWIIQNLTLDYHVVEAGSSFQLNCNEVMIIKTGLLIEQDMGEKAGMKRLLGDKRILFTIKGALSFYALETTTYEIISAETFFDELDAHYLLADVLLQVNEELEKDLDRKMKLLSLNSVGRIKMVLDSIVAYYQLDYLDNPAFPKWVKINMVARAARCSVSTTSYLLNELVEKGIIEIKSSPWLLKQPLRKDDLN